MNSAVKILLSIIILFGCLGHARAENDLSAAFAAELRKHPALRLAQQGKFADAYACVQRGEDTLPFYKRGVDYYNYWAPRTPRRTSDGKPDPSRWDVYSDVNDDRIKASEELVEHYREQAAQGNPEAQTWLEKHGDTVKALRRTQDSIAPKGASPKVFEGERYPQTRTYLLKEHEVADWGDTQLQYAIHEMVARHGLPFGDRKIRSHFSQFSWYKANPSLTVEEFKRSLTSIERQNMELLGRMRDKRKP